MRKLILLFSLINCYLLNLNAQITEQWVKRFNGLSNSYDIANYIIYVPPDKVVVTGLSTDTLSHNSDLLTIMFDQSGNQIWKAHYNGTGNNSDYGSCIAADSEGNIIIAGSSIYQDPGYGALLIKYNSIGIRQWIIRDDYQGEYRFGMVVKTDNSGNIYLGTKYGTFASGTGTITKYSPNGNYLWRSQPGRVYDILISNDGSVYAAGTRNYKYFLHKYSQSGTLIRQDTLGFGPGSGGGSLNDGPCFIVNDNSNNIYLTGFGYPIGSEDTYIRKVSSSGQILWENTFSYSANSIDKPSAILLDSAGNVYIGGNTNKGFAGFDYDYFVIKYSNSGIYQWAGYYNGVVSKNDILTDIVFDTDQNIIATGYSQHDNSIISNDFATVKFGNTGAILWEKRYNGPNDSSDYSKNIAADNFGNFFVAGGSGSSNAGLDFVTIKYTKTSGINQISSEIPTGFSLSQNYPNPFNQSSIIKFQCSIAGNVQVKVFDITGKEVATLVNEKLQPGVYEVTFDARPGGSSSSDLPSGIYFYQLRTKDFVQTKKLILLK